MSPEVPLIACGAVACLIGAGLLSAGAQGDWLGHAWHIERFFYRYHRWTGGLVVFGALVFMVLLASYPESHALAGGIWDSPQGARLLEVTLFVAWSFATIALLLGICVAIRPSLLKPLESQANRWVGPRPAPSPHPRRQGVIFLIIGGACLGIAASL